MRNAGLSVLKNAFPTIFLNASKWIFAILELMGIILEFRSKSKDEFTKTLRIIMIQKGIFVRLIQFDGRVGLQQLEQAYFFNGRGAAI